MTYYPKFVGGAEVAVKEIVERQEKGKYEFHMLTLRFDSSLPKYEVIHGIHVHRIGFTRSVLNISDLRKFPLFLNKYYFQLFAAFYAMRLHLKYKFDATWAMMAHSCGVPAGIFKIFFPKVKYILTLQEGDPPGHIEKLASPFFPPISTISYWFFKNGFRRADMVQTISTFLEKWATRMGNTKYHTVIPNGVDVAKFTQEFSVQELEAVKDTLGRKEGETWLITTSRLVHKNAIDDCIRAIQLLGSNFHFAVLGIGPDEDKLKNLAKELGVQDRIHFLGQMQYDEIPKYLKACDIFIRPSRSEGMGNSFVEAFAARIPVIATTEGGLSDLIFDGGTAFAVPANSPHDIQRQVMQIISNKVNTEKIVHSAYHFALERFSWDLVAKRMQEEIFSKI